MNAIGKVVNKLFQKTLTYKFYFIFYSLYQYIKDYAYISDFIYADSFYNLLRRYLHINPRKDWLGRIYGVINPNIDINGNYDVSSIIIELDGNETNNNEQVQHFVYKQLRLVSQLFKINNLWSYMSLSFRKVGPVNADNYLLIFDITSRKIFVQGLQKFLIHLFVYLLIAAIIYFIIL